MYILLVTFSICFFRNSKGDFDCRSLDFELRKEVDLCTSLNGFNLSPTLGSGSHLVAPTRGERFQAS